MGVVPRRFRADCCLFGKATPGHGGAVQGTRRVASRWGILLIFGNSGKPDSARFAPRPSLLVGEPGPARVVPHAGRSRQWDRPERGGASGARS
jgi:hypothetical protein